MNKTKTICYLGILTALYVVLSAFFKFNLIGNIQVDLGYVVFAVALCAFGVSGTLVGILGCSLESIIFSAYGFSVSWAAANLIIGLCCGLLYNKKLAWNILITLIATALGLIGIKTIIECSLYNIPYAVKTPKNLVAFAVDFAAMTVGLVLYKTSLHTKLKE